VSSTDETAIPSLGDSPPPQDSATVIVLRDAPAGLEVFMLERHLKSDFVGGAYVFPGGKVDDADCDPALQDFIDGPPASEAAALVQAPPGRALGFHLCAIRETFEESGVLLARDAKSGEIVRLDGDDRARFADARRALIARETDLLRMARALDIRYALDLMFYSARWITPEGLHRRYDARFFISALPEGQTPVHDAVETTASLWVRPQDALKRARAGELMVIFPTRKTLEELATHNSVAEAIASTVDKEIIALLPKLVIHEGMPRVVLPGDDRFHEP
jgi:8-oxo-dGTP pyrophosphatase MutT (NUDIX family)